VRAAVKVQTMSASALDTNDIVFMAVPLGAGPTDAIVRPAATESQERHGSGEVDGPNEYFARVQRVRRCLRSP
jgi:hypothetical protein